MGWSTLGQGSQGDLEEVRLPFCMRSFTTSFRRFNPSNFVDKWSTPELVIHGSKDYRLPDTDGIGAFHALQQSVVQNHLLVCFIMLLH